MRRPVLAALVIAACAVLAWQLVVNAQGRMLLGDFRAFYCGGATLLHGLSPYAAGPLLHCEQIPQPFGLHSARDQVDLPAPFPGYALAVFAVFALLPYPFAAAAWFVLLLACTALACIFTARLTTRPPFVILTLLAVAFSVAVIPYGELAPVIFAALAGGALAVRANHRGALVIALAVIALLPHVALPVFLALFIWNRAARLPVALLCAALVVADFSIGGPQLALSYFLRVLPNHAASEIGFITQYSMTWLAQGLGAPDRVALAAGNISYLVTVVCGVWLAGLAARKFHDPAFLVADSARAGGDVRIVHPLQRNHAGVSRGAAALYANARHGARSGGLRSRDGCAAVAIDRYAARVTRCRRRGRDRHRRGRAARFCAIHLARWFGRRCLLRGVHSAGVAFGAADFTAYFRGRIRSAARRSFVGAAHLR